MKGNIFSIEVLISVVLVISVIGVIYLEAPVETKSDFEIIKFNSNKINTFYFGTTPSTTPQQNNKLCGEIAYYTDQNQVSTKKICEEVK